MRYGKLTLVEDLGIRPVGKGRKRFYLCKCDCGTIKEFQANNVRSGNSTACGLCREPSNVYTKPPGMANAYHLYDNYRRGAKKRKLSFDISFEDFLDITKLSCTYCKSPPSQILELKDKNGKPRCNGAYIYNGIDRINPEFGYTDGNMTTACGTCNISKRNMNDEEFAKWIVTVYQVWAVEKVK